jgi:hypothetical protein
MLENRILTDLRVNIQTNTVEHHFRGIGRLHVRKSDHRFPSRNLSKKQLEEIKQELEENPLFAPYGVEEACQERNKKEEPVFRILQYKAPIVMAKALKKQFRGQFITGNYAEEERLKRGSPHTKHTIAQRAVDAVTQAQLYNAGIEKVREDIRDHISKTQPQRKQAFHTRLFNQLNKPYLQKEELSEEEQTQLLKTIPQSILEKRKQLEVHRDNTKNIDGVTPFLKNEKLEVLVEEGIIEFQGHLTAKEILSSKWAFFDIEVPHYDKENPLISWVGIIYYENGVEKKEIHTLYDVGKKTYQGYTMYKYSNEQTLVKGVANSIRTENPFVVSAFNNEFDFVKLNEGEGFYIGEEGKKPLQEVTTKFFKRVGVQGRLTVDLLRFAQLCYDYLPNKKLELISKTILGEKGLTKSISYEQMGTLEYIVQGKGTLTNIQEVKTLLEQQAQKEGKLLEDVKGEELKKLAGRLIAHYVAGDVDIMPQLFTSKDFETFVGIATDISAIAAIPLQWALYSPRSIQHVLRRSFFDRYGTHKENLFWNQAEQRKTISDAKQYFRKVLEEHGGVRAQPGLYTNVHVAYLKYGHQFKDILARTVHATGTVLGLQAPDSFSSYVLGRYGNALADWLVVDYAMIEKEKKKLNRLSQRAGIEISELYKLHWEVLDRMKENASKTHYQAFIHGTVTSRILRRYLNPYYISKIEQLEGKTIRKTQQLQKRHLELLTQIINITRSIEMKAYKFNEEYKVGKTPRDAIAYIDNKIGNMFFRIEEFAEKNKLSIIHQEGPYVYFSGDISTIKNKNIFVGSIDQVLITHNHTTARSRTPGEQKLYYNIHNVFKGVKVSDDPSHYLNLFEMNTIYKQFLEHVFAGKREQAIQAVGKAVRRLHNQDINTHELVEYSKSSKRYSGYEQGEKIFFTTFVPHKQNEQGEELEEKVETFIDEERNRLFYVDSINRKQRKVYVMSPQDLKPDWDLYLKRCKKKVYDLLYSLVGSATDNLYSQATGAK